MKFNVGIWPKPQISLIGKKYLEIGLNNKQTHVVGRKLGQNVSSTCNNYQNWFMGLKDMSQKANFEREPMEAHSCYIKRKVAGKGIFSCHIGE